MAALKKKFQLKEKVPVSVAKPGLNQLRGHEGDMEALRMSSKKYKVTKQEKVELKKGRSGGAAINIDVGERPTDPVKEVSMAKLRKGWLEKTLPRLATDPTPSEKTEKTIKYWDLLKQASGQELAVTGRKARYSNMGVKGQKWEIFIWGVGEADAIGLGYGTYTDALYIALDSAIATMMKRVKEKEGTLPPVPDVSDDEDEEDEEMEEFEEMEEMEENEEQESYGDEQSDEQSEEEITQQIKRRKQ
eukprot:TRINITY_DN16986_c0_g1_i1.p1 TRINITY_DN16986_c0_g1~~TRINITY_DN16986_c0_g1_i1.p1  ORF type:complete len:263 (+),score=65.46 TRINITY_DN16986_c0_g1_i1:54-791(+)